jgi:hypothetical protein
MHRLYLVLKDHDKPPTPDEIAFALGKKALDPKSEADYLRKLEDTMENIRKAFSSQEAQAAVHLQILFVKSLTYLIIFTRVHGFEHLLTEWIVACDQPFDEVEKEEFVKLMT